MPRFPREGRSSHPCFAGFASSTSRRHDEHQSLLEAQQTSGSFTSSFSREKKNDLDDLDFDDDDFDDDDFDDDETTHASGGNTYITTTTPNNTNTTNGVSHQSARVYLKNLVVVACMMMMCTLATCVGIASAYRPSRTGMVGRRDVHPNKNVHVVTESFNDVKESNMVIDDYIEKKKEKMMRERERLEEMSKKKETTTTQTKTGKSASSSTKKGKDHHSKKSSRKRNKTLTRANENGFEQHEHNQHQPSTKDPVTPTTTTTTTTTTAAAAIVENITPKTLLETVRDVKHVREAEKKAKENGGSFAVIAGIGNSSAASPSHSTLSSNIKGDIDDNDNTDEKMTPVAAAIVPGSVAVLGPQTSVKNSIESIELISNATSQNAQSWGIEDEEDEEDEGQSEATTTTTTTTTTGRRGKSTRKKKDQRSSQQP